MHRLIARLVSRESETPEGDPRKLFVLGFKPLYNEVPCRMHEAPMMLLRGQMNVATPLSVGFVGGALGNCGSVWRSG